jgi:hypothetical protein
VRVGSLSTRRRRPTAAKRGRMRGRPSNPETRRGGRRGPRDPRHHPGQHDLFDNRRKRGDNAFCDSHEFTVARCRHPQSGREEWDTRSSLDPSRPRRQRGHRSGSRLSRGGGAGGQVPPRLLARVRSGGGDAGGARTRTNARSARRARRAPGARTHIDLLSTAAAGARRRHGSRRRRTARPTSRSMRSGRMCLLKHRRTSDKGGRRHAKHDALAAKRRALAGLRSGSYPVRTSRVGSGGRCGLGCVLEGRGSCRRSRGVFPRSRVRG